MTAAQTVAAAVLESSASPCMTCSFQAEDVAVLHMLLEMRTDIQVLFLDTVHHFEQTYAYRDKIAQAWGLRLVNLRAAEPSPGLWQTSTDACCAKHKVEPFTLPSGKVIRKISPLARWSMKEVWDYAKANEIPLLPLYEIGYTSIGCEPCTSLPLDASNPRSGRWQGQKLECGIHVQPAAVAGNNKS